MGADRMKRLNDFFSMAGGVAATFLDWLYER
jgi:hypothetical protein